MKVCLPVKSDLGIESLIFAHFAKAPCYVLFDSETKEVSSIVNEKKQHEHGDCNPLTSFTDTTPDIIIVAGIGSGALSKLHDAGIRVFKAEGTTVKDNLEVLTSKGLREFNAEETCSGHKHGETHSCHGHDDTHEHKHDHEHGKSDCCGGSHANNHSKGGCCH
jgi:predicted Fe-Mo cluster-binding NifX family protein